MISQDGLLVCIESNNQYSIRPSISLMSIYNRNHNVALAIVIWNEWKHDYKQ